MSKTTIAAGLISVAVSALLGGCGGSANLRGPDGKLAFCDHGPHCVSSESLNPDRYIAPITYNGSREAAHAAMVKIIGDMKNARIVTDQPDYIHAEFTSSIMHYVDDLELVFPQEKLIQVRSSSRIGYYDYDVNHDRVEAIRKAFTAIQP
ncbi:MAG TPA: DUF1499 domain-containing protein [Stenotrophobium sp.]|jgi:uncharacterized protein (DUF1499 family)|nr:DUF1499 domain-containing protein [Stenotrophobium sp.]